MDFFVRCKCKFRRFTGGKSRNLHAADGGKGIARRAAELCGGALGLLLIIAPKPAVSSSVTQSFEKKRSSSALFAREINLVTQPSFDCEQGINSQVQTACSNADAIFPVLGIVFCKNERFSLLRKTHVPLWNAPRISHVRLP